MLKHTPNILTIMRMLLVAPFVIVLYDGQYLAALLLLFVAAITDALDGFLARHYGWHSWFGSMADPLADKMLLIASYVVLGLLGHIPLELTYLVVGRDVLIFAGALWIWVYVRHFEATPTLLGKLCTFLMIVQALLVLTSLALFELPAGLLTTGNILVALSCIVSGAQYIFLGVSEAKTVKVTPR